MAGQETSGSNSAEAAGGGPVDPRLWLGFTFLALGLLVIALDLSITDVTVPSIVADLGISADDASLVVTVYMVVAASTMIMMGKVADVIGARRAFLAGCALFAVGSIVTGLADSLGMLLLGRSIQGLVAAIAIPASLSLLNHAFPGGRSRVLAFSIWTAVIGSAMALGPLLGGLLATELSWRWAFFINAPIMVICIVGTYLTVRPPGVTLKENGFDIPGSALLIPAIALPTFALQEAPELGWWTALSSSDLPISVVPVFIALGLGLGVVFVLVERDRAARSKGVVLEFSLFEVKSFTWGTLGAAFMTAGVFGLMLMIPWYAQYVLDADPLGAGVVLAPLGVGMAIGGPIISRTSWSLRRTVILMLAIQPVMTLALIPFLGVDAEGWWLAPWLMIDGLAWGAAFSILVSLLLRDVPKNLSGVAGGTQTAARLLFGAVGGALLTAILLGSVAASMSSVDESDLTAQEQHQIQQLYTFSAQLHPPTSDPDGETAHEKQQDEDFAEVIDDTKQDMVRGIQLAVVAAALFAALGLICGWRLEEDTASDAEQDQSI